VTDQPYSEQVPAVSRAIRVLQALVGTGESRSLTSIAREIEAGPSSTLAILNTLRSFGLVERLEPEGRYLPGPGLMALGLGAATALDAVQTFDQIAPALVDQVGETVLLWMRTGDLYVLAAAREGTRSLRYVPQLGLQLPPSDLAATRSEIEPGVSLLLAPLPSARPQEEAFLAIAGPTDRLGIEAERALALAVGSLPGPDERQWELSGPIEQDELDIFLGQGIVATLSYLSDDGYPSTIPLWFDWDRDSFWLLPRAGAEWTQHVIRNPRVSLAVSESTPPLRRVLVRGAVEVVADSDGQRNQQLVARLSRRYAGLDAARLLPGGSGQVLRLRPQQLIAWRGLLQHPGANTEPTARGSQRRPA
jgi:DNA-binding IclR family transcriptional regulator/nitroimidazol reductase NimA-like FMN-containing flavoprotein (pyridoxamine 5'-phosphate oxidase superfamily)